MSKPDHNQCTESLRSVGDALYVIGGKWTLRIIVALSDRAKRFNELQRVLDGISARVLSNELKQLELNGFVKRHVYIKTPVIIEYELTKYSESVKKIVEALSEWGATHRNKIRTESKKKA